MTSKFTREQTQQIIDAADAVISALAGTNDEVHKDDTDKMIRLWDDLNDRYAPPEVVRELARMALASMDGEPVAYTDGRNLGYIDRGREMAYLWGKQNTEVGDIALYRHAQPAPVVPNGLRLALSNAGIAAPESDEMLAATCEKHIQALVTWVKDRKPFQSAPVVPSFEEWLSAANRKPLGWVKDAMREAYDACRSAILQAGNCRENGNSSTNNFREIAGTSTGAAITPAAPDKKLTDDVLDEIIAGAKTSMEQYLALSLKAEREVWRKEGPTDDERIMAIEGIHNCERCGDEGWVVGEMGITRCACGQAGNSPVIPDGYVMVPKEPTKEMIDAGWLHYMGTKNPSSKGTYKAMLAAAPQEVKK